MKYGNFISKQYHKLSDAEKNEILSILNNAVEPYRAKFGVQFVGIAGESEWQTAFEFKFDEVNGRNAEGSRIKKCSNFCVLISKESGVLEDKSDCPNGIWDVKYVKYNPTPFEFSYNANVCSNGEICGYKHRGWYGIHPKNNYQYGTEFSDLDLTGLVQRFFAEITVEPAKAKLPSPKATKSFAGLINKTARKLGFKVEAEFVSMRREAYNYLVDYDTWRAYDNGDYDYASGQFKAIRLIYPPEYYAPSHYLTTAEIKDHLRGATNLESMQTAIYGMCAI